MEKKSSITFEIWLLRVRFKSATVTVNVTVAVAVGLYKLGGWVLILDAATPNIQAVVVSEVSRRHGDSPSCAPLRVSISFRSTQQHMCNIPYVSATSCLHVHIASKCMRTGGR